MELSLEIPLPDMEEFLPLTDFPFGLAHLVLNPHWGRYRSLMQGCLLDNGMYELGNPLSVEQLIRAASLVKPTALIAPDWEGDMRRTLHGVEECLAFSVGRRTWTVGALVQGKNTDERVKCFYELKSMGCRPIGFPFRSSRDKTIALLLARSAFDGSGWYHLFGLRSDAELCWDLPGRWSLDTGKPFKGFRMDRTPIRGHGRLNLLKPLDQADRYTALYNIAWMRKEMHD